MGDVAERTRTLLVQRARVRPLTTRQRSQLDATLRHLAAVREGFQLSLRTGDGVSHDEIVAVVRYTLDVIDWSFLTELGLRLGQDRHVYRLGNQLLAFAHATVALGVLPHLPASEITHPTSAHYRDLHTPRSPGEWLERIEELETVLIRIQSDHWNWPTDSSLRRTHAYFDATAWLIRSHLERFDRPART
jgi:hypothetical protein